MNINIEHLFTIKSEQEFRRLALMYSDFKQQTIRFMDNMFNH
jgi:hypothetical protein